MILPSQLPDNLTTPVAWDTETSSLYPDQGGVSVVSVAWFENNQVDVASIRAAAWPFAQGAEGKPGWSGQDTLFGSAFELNLPEHEWNALRAWLLKQRQLIEHNGQFDLVMTGKGIMPHRGFKRPGVDLLENTFWDTMIGCTLLWPRSNKGLKPTAERLWGVEERSAEQKVKAWLKKNKYKIADGVRYDLVPWDLMEPYATVDAELTLRLWLEQWNRFDQTSFDWHHFRATLMPVMKQLVRMERRGLPYAVQDSIAVGQKVEAARLELGTTFPFKPTGADAKVYFYGDGSKLTAKNIEPLGLQATRFSEKTGAPSLNVDALRDLVDIDAPYAADWQTHELLKRTQGMYYDGWAEKTGPDNRLRARLRQFGTISSRFSIEYANLQAMPKDAKLEGLENVGLGGLPTPRQLISKEVADSMPGWVLMEYDLSQAELRSGGLLAGCQPILDEYFNAVLEGREADLHTVTSEAIGCARGVGKMANFLLLYGGGYKMMREQIEKMTGGKVKLTAAEAFEVHKGFHRAYPEITEAVKRWETFVDRKGYVPLVGGAKSWFRNGEDAHKGWNRRVQGSIAQFFLQWLLDAEQICNEYGVQEQAIVDGIGGAGPLICVHDSVVCLLPKDIEPAVTATIKSRGSELWDDFFDAGVPGLVDSKIFG